MCAEKMPGKAELTPEMIQAGVDAIADFIGPGSEENISEAKLREYLAMAFDAALGKEQE